MLFFATFSNKWIESIRLEHESEPPEEEPEEFLPSDEEEEEEDFTARSYVPSHMPKFPSKHSFQRTPVSEMKKGADVELSDLTCNF